MACNAESTRGQGPFLIFALTFATDEALVFMLCSCYSIGAPTSALRSNNLIFLYCQAELSGRKIALLIGSAAASIRTAQQKSRQETGGFLDAVEST